MRQTRILAALFATALLGAFGAAAYAANPEPVVAEVEFVAPITITENNALQFGLVDVGMAASDTIVISPAGGVTDNGNNLLNSAQAAADLTVAATAGQAINILVDNITNGTGYALGSFQCDYNGGADVGGCDGAGLDATAAASAALTIGATLTGNGLATVGQANGSFDVTVAYQ